MGVAPPDAWMIDVKAGGNLCVLKAAGIILWRPAPRPAATVVLGPKDGTATRMSWPADSATLSWPANVPANDNTIYQIQIDPGARGTFVLHVAATAPSDDRATLEWLAVSHCDGQVQRLLTTLGDRRVVDGVTTDGKTVFE